MRQRPAGALVTDRDQGSHQRAKARAGKQIRQDGNRLDKTDHVRGNPAEWKNAPYG